MTGDELYRIRYTVLGMTQAELAQAIGYDHTTISKMESGSRVVTRRTERALGMLIEQQQRKESQQDENRNACRHYGNRPMR